MSDLICRKTMRRCETPSMCVPFGGCGDPSDERISKLERDLSAALERIRDLEAVERMRDEEIASVREKAGNTQIELDAALEREQRVREALEKLLLTLEEAKATLSMENAKENFTDPEPEVTKYERAMVKASDAANDARRVLSALAGGKDG